MVVLLGSAGAWMCRRLFRGDIIVMNLIASLNFGVYKINNVQDQVAITVGDLHHCHKWDSCHLMRE